MPELPEVETVVTTLRPRLAGGLLRRLDLRRADILRTGGADLGSLAGHRVDAVERRGKKILVRLDSGTLCIHLGMTGRLTVGPPDSPFLPHTHLVIDFTPQRSSSPQQVRFRDPRRFGGVWWLPDGCPADDRLGPEPLTMRPDDLFQRLSRTRRAIKSALLDQAVVAGLGNIYVDESLFAAGIHPLIPANQLNQHQVAHLTRCIKRVLQRAIRARGSSFRDYVDADGHPGSFQKLHRVYAREAMPCAKCGHPVARIVLSGRSTHFCPRCQPPSL